MGAFIACMYCNRQIYMPHIVGKGLLQQPLILGLCPVRILLGGV